MSLEEAAGLSSCLMAGDLWRGSKTGGRIFQTWFL